MGLVSCLARLIVYPSLLAAIVLNAAVIAQCDYLQVVGGSIGIGLFTVGFGSGECFEYESEYLDTPIKTARVSSVLAMCFGALVLVAMVLDEFCRVPCGGFCIGIGFLGVQVCCALTWLIYRNEYCLRFGCDWGDTATLNLIAQILYLGAALFSGCIGEKFRERNRGGSDAGEGN